MSDQKKRGRGRPPLIYEDLLDDDTIDIETKKLSSVTTISEICEVWSVSRHKVLMDIQRGGLLAVQSGKVWIISSVSVRRLYNGGEGNESINEAEPPF